MQRSLMLMFLCAAMMTAVFCQEVSGNAIVGLGYLYPQVAVAPGQLITVFVAGNVQGNIRAAVQDIQAPVLAVRPASGCQLATPCSSVTAVTIQIPYEIAPPCIFTNPACNVIVAAPLVVTANGVAGPPIQLTPVADRVHILTSCDTVVPNGNGFAPYSGLPCPPLVTHADGSLVTAASPAHGGEAVVAYATGLGLTAPAIKTGQAAATATPTYEIFYLDFNFRPDALATKPNEPLILPPTDFLSPSYSGLTPGFVGLYQINLMVPSSPAGLQACSTTVQSNLTVSVGGQTSFDGAGICVAP